MAKIEFTPNQKEALKLDGGKMVLAGAGSGKTTVLAERYLRLLQSGETKPREIVAITFTKKAAANLEAKIRKEILKKSENDGNNKEFWQQVNQEMQWARIGTIHGFLTKILRSHPLEAGVDPEFIIVGEEAKASTQNLEKLLGKKQYSGDEGFVGLIQRFGKYDELKAGCTKLLNFMPLILLLEKYESRKQALVDYLNAEYGKFQEEFGLNKNEESTGDHAEYVALLYEVYDLIQPVIIENRNEMVAELSYDDLEYYTLDLMKNNSKVLRKVTKGIKALLVDEFQDTSTIQWELVKLLASTEGKVFDDSKVFFVGDEKQSIYGFRGANVTNVRDAEGEFKKTPENNKNWIVNLNDNFRTQSEITEKINKLFEKVLVPRDAKSHVYEARSQSLKPSRKVAEGVESAIELYYQEEGEENQLYSTMASKIKEDVGSGSYRVEGDVDGRNESRKLRYTDIGILVRSWKTATKIEKQFKDKAVPYTVVGGKGFLEKQEIKDVKNLIDAFENEFNKIAVMGVLRGPVFSLSDRQIAVLFKETNDVIGDWKNLVDGRQQAKAALLEKEELEESKRGLEKWMQIKGRFADENPVENILWTLETSGALAAYAVGMTGKQKIANIEKYLDLLNEVERKGASTLSLLKEGVAEAEKSLIENEAEADVSAGEGVKILTIFGAKGLEFPYVILPDLGNPGPKQASLNKLDKGNLIVKKSDLSILTDPSLGLFAKACSDDTKQIHNLMHSNISKIENDAEVKRLLYVAMTRAKDRLVIFGHFNNTKGKNPPPIKHIADALGIEGTGKKSDKLKIPENPIISLIKLDKLAEELENKTNVNQTNNSTKDALPDFRLYTVPPKREFHTSFTKFSKFLAEAELKEKQPKQPDLFTEKKDSGGLGKEIGTIVHKALQKFGPLVSWEESRGFVKSEVELLDADDKKEIRNTIKRLIGNIKLFAIQKLEGRIHREIPVSLKLGKLTLNGNVDLALYGENRVEVYDYKTNAVNAGNEGAVSREMGYDHQLKLYALCLKNAWDKRENSGKLLYLDSGGVDEYSVNDSDLKYYEKTADEYIKSLNN